MMRSLFAGVSGLRTHQTRMDVIGNNIANVNTYGFKAARVTFADLFSQTIAGAGGPNQDTGRGGTNPRQVGLGVTLATIDNLMTQGALQNTDNPTDLALEGSGFFIVQGGRFDSYKFTRAGNFGLDKLGNFVNGDGLNVMGWQSYVQESNGNFVFDTEQPLEALNIYQDIHNGNKRVLQPRVTSDVQITGNLDADVTVNPAPTPGTDQAHFTVPMVVYDKLGNSYSVNLAMYKIAADETGSTWGIYPGQPINTSGNYSFTLAPGSLTTIQFDVYGKYVPPSGGATSYIGSVDLFTGATNVTGTDNFEFEFDLAYMTSYSADNTAKAMFVSGYPTGTLLDFSVGTDGIITGVYSNGQQRPLGMVALAVFENPAGLAKLGNNLYQPTTNSGDFRKAVRAGMEGAGTFAPGKLEMSNVDLSREFTDMIITQRGFQANSRIITTSDEMLQELVNLKR
ncbi:MAG: flagellar hook protein FlgE [Oscillospiraceae bacterium]|nr:flagellar hook protein FlgE [Oscillospiraceae bacterium]